MSTNHFRCFRDFCALPGVQVFHKSGMMFALPDTEFREFLQEHLADLDDMITNGEGTKTSIETNACIAQLPNRRKIFLKRNDNRGFLYTLRYLFMPARIFRAALAAHEVEAAGVMTPRVLGAGEFRRGRVLRSAYLITDAVLHSEDLMAYVGENPVAPVVIDTVLDETAKAAAALHLHGLYHGDMKLVNIYRTRHSDHYGVWDLDSVQKFPGTTPPDLIVRELGRIVSSFFICAESNPAFPESFFNLEGITELLLSAYARCAPALLPLSEDVMSAARSRWLDKRKLRHSYGD